MARAVAMLLFLPLLAGCLGNDGPATTDAGRAFSEADGAARERFGYTLFLGITGTEGPLDWSRFEAALAGAGGPGPQLAAFDQDVPNGRLGDGRLGSWLTTHFAYDEEERLIGGLYTQVLASGERHAAFASFSGPYAGTTQLPSMLHPDARASLEGMARFQQETQAPDDTVLCTLQTHTRDWILSSGDAADIALADAEFQAHMDALPEGELSYYYFPALAVEEACPVDIEVPNNFWAVSYTDLDTFLDPETESPPLYTLRIDAATGAVQDRSVLPLVLRAPTILEQALEATDPPLPTTGYRTHALPVEVEEHASSLELQTHRTQRATYMFADETRLRDPAGRVVDASDFSNAVHRYAVQDPEPGTWTLEYRYRSLTPNGEHRLEVRGAVSYH